PHLLTEIVIIFGVSLLVVLIFNKLKLPPIVGFLLTGIIAGPHGFKLVSAIHEVEVLAEIGVILILFSIGIEFSFTKLMRIKKNIFIGGSVQVLTTIVIVYIVAWQTGFDPNISVFLGFLVALSSTALVLKLYLSKSLIDSPQGKISLSVLIYQDIAVLPMFLLVPILAGTGADTGASILNLLLKVAAILVFLFVTIRYVMPRLMYFITKTGIRELFLLSILLICFSIVWLSSLMGISLALGAFLAGIIISETEYSHEALSFIEPLRDVFASFFFVSIGMLLNLSYFADNIPFILSLSAGLIILKALTATAAAKVLGFPWRISVMAGLSLAQIGEFSFVLMQVGLDVGLLEGSIYQNFLAASVISLAATPFMFNFAPKIASVFRDIRELPKEPVSSEGHIIIIGYGLNGRNISHAAEYAGIKYTVIEVNPMTVRQEKAKGVNIIYGDATNETILHAAGIEKARIVVSTIPDPSSDRRITQLAKRMNPEVHLIIRTRYISEVDELYKLGADEVIPEEFETSLEIFVRVLNKYMIPRDEINKLVSDLRQSGYKRFRDKPGTKDFSSLAFHAPDHDISSFKVKAGSFAEGSSIKELAVREKYNVTILAVKKNSNVNPNPGPDEKLNENDLLIVYGRPEDINKFSGLLE
ncbi:MAG: cation:proton antiporter, partial [Candidatus Kapaibacterium sp.]